MARNLDPALQTAVLAAAEQAVNRALEMAPASQRELAALDGCVFGLHCTAPELDVYLQPGPEGVRLMSRYGQAPTTSVKGSASDFSDLATSSDPAATLINGALELEGDSGPLIELQKILSGLDMDWEASLVEHLGDVAGHQLAELLRATFNWSKATGNSLGRQLSEFIHEEARLTPPRLELEDFYRDVQELGQRVDRLEARAQRLYRRLLKAADER